MLESVFNYVYLKETPAQVFSGEICENFKSTYFEKTSVCGRLFLRILQEKLLNSTSRFLYFNVYRLFRFSTVGSVWYTPTNHEQCSFIMYDSAGRESHPPADKCMPKVISHHTKNVKTYLNLASCSS